MNSQMAPSRAGVVDLVGDDEHRAATLAEQLGDVRVLLGDADDGVDDEQRDVGVAGSAFSLWRETFWSRSSPPREPAAGVDELERVAVPLRVDLLAVAGDPGALLDDRLAASDDAVEQRGLAHVRPADDGDDRA